MVKTFPFLRLCDNGVVETFDREELAKLRGHKSHMEYEEFLEKANQISFSDSSIAIYNSFREQVYSPQSVLYSSCGYDASPAKVFENVTFVDIEEGCVKKLQEAGLHALKQNIKTYIPKDLHDLLILLCPATPPGWATRHLKPGGYVIADEWHQTATNIYRQPQKFTLLGTIDVKRDKSVVISRNLDDLFEPVKDFVELQRLRPGHSKDLEKIVSHFVQNGDIKVDSNANFEQKWAAYRKYLSAEGLPYKREAGRYIFVKK